MHSSVLLMTHTTSASLRPQGRSWQHPAACQPPQQLAVGSMASSSTVSRPKGTDLVRAMPEGAGSTVRRSLQGGGEASLSSLLPSTPPAELHHLRLPCCWARAVLTLHGRGGSMAPAAAAGQGCMAVPAWPVQLSLRPLLRVLDRVHSAGLEVGVPAHAAATIVPADPPLLLRVSSSAAGS